VSHWLYGKLYWLVSHQPLVCLLRHCDLGSRSQQVLASVNLIISISLLDIKHHIASNFISISSSWRKPPMFWKAIQSVMPCFFIKCPHSSRPLWCDTHSSKGVTEFLVGGFLRVMLCWLWWTSPTSQLCKVVMSDGQIHFHGLWLGIDGWLKIGQIIKLLFAWWVDQNKT